MSPVKVSIPQRCAVRAVMHRVTRWVDRTGGVCVTACGKTLDCGTTRAQYIADEPSCQWESCPLCECAMLFDHMPTQRGDSTPL